MMKDVNNYKIYVLTFVAKDGKQIANSCISLLTVKVDHSYTYDFLAFGSYKLPKIFNQPSNL